MAKPHRARDLRRRQTKSVRVLCGQRVKALREGQGLTRTRLAGEAGVALTSLNLIEAGRIYPTLRTLEFLARALGCRVADLVDDQPAPTMPPGGTKAFFRVVQKLRDRDDNYLRAVEKLIRAFDEALEQGGS